LTETPFFYIGSSSFPPPPPVLATHATLQLHQQHSSGVIPTPPPPLLTIETPPLCNNKSATLTSQEHILPSPYRFFDGLSSLSSFAPSCQSACLLFTMVPLSVFFTTHTDESFCSDPCPKTPGRFFSFHRRPPPPPPSMCISARPMPVSQDANETFFQLGRTPTILPVRPPICSARWDSAPFLYGVQCNFVLSYFAPLRIVAPKHPLPQRDLFIISLIIAQPFPLCLWSLFYGLG